MSATISLSCQNISSPCANVPSKRSTYTGAVGQTLDSSAPRNISPLPAFKAQSQMPPLGFYPVCEISVNASLSCPNISSSFGTATSIFKENSHFKTASLQSKIMSAPLTKSFSALFLSASLITRKEASLFRRGYPLISETCLTLGNASASSRKSRQSAALPPKKSRKKKSTSPLISQQPRSSDLQISPTSSTIPSGCRNKSLQSGKCLSITRNASSSLIKPAISDQKKKQITLDSNSPHLNDFSPSRNKKTTSQQAQMPSREKHSANADESSFVKKVPSHSRKTVPPVKIQQPPAIQQSHSCKAPPEASSPNSQKPLPYPRKVSTHSKKKKAFRKDSSLSFKAYELSMKSSTPSKTTFLQDHQAPKSIENIKHSPKKASSRSCKAYEMSINASLPVRKESSTHSKMSSHTSLSHKLHLPSQSESSKHRKASSLSQKVSLLVRKASTTPYKETQAPAPAVQSPSSLKAFPRKALSALRKTTSQHQKPSASCKTKPPAGSSLPDEEENSEFTKKFSHPKNESSPSLVSSVSTLKISSSSSESSSQSLETCSLSPKAVSPSLYTSSSASLFRPAFMEEDFTSKSPSDDACSTMPSSSAAPKGIASISQGILASLEAILATSEDVITSHAQLLSISGNLTFRSAISSSSPSESSPQCRLADGRASRPRRRVKSCSPGRSARKPWARDTYSCEASPLLLKKNFSPYSRTQSSCRKAYSTKVYSPRWKLSPSSRTAPSPPRRSGKDARFPSTPGAARRSSRRIRAICSSCLLLSFVMATMYLITMYDAFTVISWLFHWIIM